MRILDVYLHNIYAGQLIQDKSGNLSFVYDSKYIKTNRPALSISLPLHSDPYKTIRHGLFFPVYYLMILFAIV